MNIYAAGAKLPAIVWRFEANLGFGLPMNTQSNIAKLATTTYMQRVNSKCRARFIAYFPPPSAKPQTKKESKRALLSKILLHVLKRIYKRDPRV